jgi:uncharacterized protein (DUF433 family)
MIQSAPVETAEIDRRASQRIIWGERSCAMSIELSPTELAYLERLLERPANPTRRQGAKALLLLAQGQESRLIAQIVGIPRHEVDRLKEKFTTHRIAALDRQVVTGIEKTAGVCGGSARIAGTRIPVWQLVAARDQGVSEAQLLLDYPGLRAEDLVNAWIYAKSHREDIESEILENEVA